MAMYSEALHKIQSGQMKTWEASKKYGIPRTTLRSAVKRRQKAGTSIDAALSRLPLVVNHAHNAPVQSGNTSSRSDSDEEPPRPTAAAPPPAKTPPARAKTPEKINKAVRAVIINRQGVARVAETYGVPVDVLKTQVSLQKSDFDALFSRAVEAVRRSDMSVFEAAEQFALPKGEIMRRMNRCEEPVRPPSPTCDSPINLTVKT